MTTREVDTVAVRNAPKANDQRMLTGFRDLPTLIRWAMTVSMGEGDLAGSALTVSVSEATLAGSGEALIVSAGALDGTVSGRAQQSPAREKNVHQLIVQ